MRLSEHDLVKACLLERLRSYQADVAGRGYDVQKQWLQREAQEIYQKFKHTELRGYNAEEIYTVRDIGPLLMRSY